MTWEKTLYRSADRCNNEKNVFENEPPHHWRRWGDDRFNDACDAEYQQHSTAAERTG
jgi:hypothetical protein